MQMLKDQAAFLRSQPREYSDELARQIIQAVKIIDSETMEVFFKNGNSKIQTMTPRIKSRSANGEEHLGRAMAG